MSDSGVPPEVTGRILVVDDHEPNRLLLAEVLRNRGHEVLLAGSGQEALDRVADSAPDLLLLDVNMPGMDGLEVCRRLRSDPATASLPIILVTSLTHREHRLEGIAAGANDYLNKPIDRTDLLLRVRNALYLWKLHREVADQYQQLQRLENLRDNLVHMLVHDLRSPLTGIQVYLDLTRLRLEELGHADVLSDVEEAGRNARLLTDMVGNVLDVSRFEADAMPLQRAPVDLVELVQQAIASLGGSQRSVTVEFDPPGGAAPALADGDIIRRVVANLLGNALKFSPRGGVVRVEVSTDAAGSMARITDAGPGIAPEHHARIFEKFGQVERKDAAAGRSTGLGLTFCKLAVEAHGGRIGVESAPGKGSTFWFGLPVP